MARMAEVRSSLHQRMPGLVDEQLLTVSEVAATFRVSRGEIYEACRTGSIPCRQDPGPRGRVYYIRTADARTRWGVS